MRVAEVREPVYPKSMRATLVFCLAAAITAAALMDPLVEFLANRGAFGAGNFTDHSNLDVIPGLTIGCFFVLAVVAGLARRALLRRSYAPAWVRRCASAGEAWSARRRFSLIFVAQLVVLWVMETIEQIAVTGHPLGGAVWLGAPAPIGLALHAFGCVVITLALARLTRWSASTIVDVVAFVRELFRITAPARRHGSRVRARVSRRFLEPILARLSGRAPPLSIA